MPPLLTSPASSAPLLASRLGALHRPGPHHRAAVRFLALTTTRPSPRGLAAMSWLGRLGLGGSPRASEASAALAQGPDEDQPAPGNELAQFGAGCFWGVELAFQRVTGGDDVGTQYRSGIYYYSPEQEKAAKESLEKQQKLLNRKIVTEILLAKRFYRAEEYHQQYLQKGGRFGFRQSAEKGCNDPIRCFG